MGRLSFFSSRRFLRAALIILALLIVILPSSSSGSSLTRITSGVLMVVAGLFFYLGASEILSGLSLSRRLVLCFFSMVLLWGLTGFVGVLDAPEILPENSRRAERVRELGRRIDSVAEAGSGHVRNFVDSTFTGQTGHFLETIGEVSGVAAGVLIDAVLTSTSVDTSVGMDTLLGNRERGDSPPVVMVPLLRLAILAVSLILLAAVRGFVYIDRTPFTVWLYRATVSIAFVTALLHVLGLNFILSSTDEIFSGIELDVSSLLLLFSAVGLGFCQRWVQYLSRKTRIFLLVATFVCLLMGRGIYYYLAGNVFPGTGGLDVAVVLIVAIYILFAFITMLLQLPTARILEKRYKELGTLQDLSQALHSSFEPEQLGAAAVRLGARLTDSDYCWFHLNDGGGDYSFGKGRELGNAMENLGKEWYTGVERRIDATGHGFMINNYRRSSLRKMENGRKGYTRIASMVAAPVEVRGERLGVIVAASVKQFFFVEYTRGLFDSFTRQIAQAIQSAQLFGEKLQRQSLERELELARNIQKNLLPGSLPQPSGWEIAAISIPSRVMGGDYYDVLELSDGRLAVAIADVSGKGAAAAMLMAALQASLGTLLKEDLSVEVTTSRLNAALCDRMPDATFITFFLAFIDLENGDIDYCSAGHDPPILCRAGENTVDNLHTGGLILGVMPEAEYQMGRAHIAPGGRLLLYTDGITETMSSSEEPFGVERLRNIIIRHCRDSGEAIIGTIGSLVELFRDEGDQEDDVTALVVARNICADFIKNGGSDDN
ncbi:MAG: PP2C family protein-serine/threonine phosphatase [Candidatus Sabulitectum sp.]|nr:PP2C family protein-serine/threonine phosphatase [Candidatus Sabulitectum sp.]